MTERSDAQATSELSRDPTIRSRVVTLVAIALLPFIGMMLWLATNYASAQRRIIEVERVAVANTLTHLLDREIAAIEGALIGLGSSEDLSSGDLARFGRHADHVLKLPQFLAIRVYDATGAVIYTTDGGSSKAIPATTRATIINNVLRGKFAVSDLSSGNTDAVPSDPVAFSVSVPVMKNGNVAYAVSADIGAERMRSVFKEAELDSTWISAIVDRNGRFVARSLNPETFVGKFARPELVEVAVGTASSGEFENATHEGTLTGNSFQRSKICGWTSVAAVPKVILDAPYRQSMTLVLLSGAVISMLSLAAATLMAARISEPIRRLRNVATALIEGRTPPDTPLRIAELNEVRAALNEAVEKKEHLAAIVASSGDAIMSVGLDGLVRSWNHGAERLFGYSAAEMIGNPKTIVVPEDRRHELAKHISVISTGQSMRAETVRLNRDGVHMDVSLDMAPIRGATGTIVAMSSIIHDITSRKAADKHQRFLMRELTHRSKNLLAIVQSMARQTARSATSMADFEKRYMHRLHGLAASHDLLVNQNWVGAPLDELILRQVDAFAETNRINVAISGPAVMISAKAAQTIGLALHELATNSMKYGALSTPKGKVSIEWVYLLTEDKPEHLELTWQEHDGPAVTPPPRKGFGHFVIDRMATQSLNAKVKIDFRPEGLIWVLTVPVAELENEPEFEGADHIG